MVLIQEVDTLSIEQHARYNHQPPNGAPNEPAGPICARKKHILGQKWSFWGRTYRETNKTIGTAIFVDRVSYHYTQAERKNGQNFTKLAKDQFLLQKPPFLALLPLGKNGYFRVRLTVGVWLCVSTQTMNMCSVTDFTQEKGNFHPTTGIPHSSSYCCCPPDDHLQESGPSR